MTGVCYSHAIFGSISWRQRQVMLLVTLHGDFQINCLGYQDSSVDGMSPFTDVS
jgi:hypothetical protein